MYATVSFVGRTPRPALLLPSDLDLWNFKTAKRSLPDDLVNRKDVAIQHARFSQLVVN
jgi:hypothetical protein